MGLEEGCCGRRGRSCPVLPWAVYPDTAQARCPERPRCSGCGCKGGPGYRGPDGRCVGFKDLAKICGTPPESRCTFENAPGTGLNQDCALVPEKRSKIN